MCVCMFQETGSLVPGVGTSLVLTQTEIVFYSYYPQQRHKAAMSHLVPHLGSSVAQFVMPLLLLGFLSLYGTRQVPLLLAGLVLQGLVGAVILHPLTERTQPFSRYHSRPRAFTFVNDESNSYFRDRYTFNRIHITRGNFHEHCFLKPH
jgi:uncharacterized membrane protein YbhN (UPF0104 family)